METSSSPYHPSIFSGCCGCIVRVHSQSRYLPLRQISARATLLSSTSRTTLTQTFRNPLPDTIKESRYVFPLFDGVSVVAFACTIGDSVIRAVVKSRPEAREDFDAATAADQHAGLMEQSDEAADVFTTTLGNIGPGQEVKVELTFVGELKHDAEVDGLRFTLPTAIAPRYGRDFVAEQYAQTETNTVDAVMDITVDVDLGGGSLISSLQSPSHPIAVQIGTTSTQPNDHSSSRASASLSQSAVHLDKDFIVQVCAAGLGDPFAILETHATLPHRKALMVSLVPRFNLPAEKPEVVFVCDRSGSMSDGVKLLNLVAALRVFLQSLPVGVIFNVCSFGTEHGFLWPKSRPYSQKTLDEATAHVGGFLADMGGTEMQPPVEATFRNRDVSRNLEVFLMTDGEIWAQDEMISSVRSAVEESKGAIRLFTLGVGRDVSHALIEGLARAGRGFAQAVGENESMSKKVVRMLKGALTPHVDDYSLEIKYDEDENEEEDFELIEKVSGCTIVDSQAVEATLSATREAISLHDPTIKDEDLEMPASKLQTLSELHLPTPTYLQTPYKMPPLFPFHRTAIYVLLSENQAMSSERTPKSVLLKGTAPQGPLKLEIAIREAAEKGTTIHQLAARKAMQDLEEGRGWVHDARTGRDNGDKLLESEYGPQMEAFAKDASVRLGLEYQVAGKWCSFVAVDKTDGAPVESDGKEMAADSTQMVTVSRKVADVRGGSAVLGSAAPSRSKWRFKRRMMASPRISIQSKLAAPTGLGAQPLQYGAFPMMASAPSPLASAPSPLASAPSPLASKSWSAPMQTETATETVQVRPAEAVISLQSFAGSWSWTAELERLVGTTAEEARSRLSASRTRAREASVEAQATLCAVAFLRVRQAEESEVWELVVGKARDWLAGELGVAMGADDEELGRVEEETARLLGYH